ncbi:MAG: hypothetical protein JJE18_04620 [Eubacteriaceae bacterium]|nr:hypothetical protein [Eubacteriaceae bacterium]
MTEQERQEQQYSEALTATAAATLVLMATQKNHYKKSWQEILKEISKIYQNDWVFEDFMKFGRKDAYDKKIEKVITDLYKSNNKIIIDTLTAEYVEKSAFQIKVLNEQSGLILIQKKFDVKTAINKPNGGVYWFDRLGKNRNDTLYSLSNAIQIGLHNGDSYSTTTKKLQDLFGEDLIKNDLIARTETKRVISTAQTDVCDAVSDKVEMVKTWRTMQDGRVRAGTKRSKGNHVKMNGKTIPYDQDFITSMGSKGKAPHQLTGPKSAWDECNCRCILLVKVK